MLSCPDPPHRPSFAPARSLLLRTGSCQVRCPPSTPQKPQVSWSSHTQSVCWTPLSSRAVYLDICWPSTTTNNSYTLIESCGLIRQNLNNKTEGMDIMNKQNVRRQTRMTETFESSVSEDNALKFHMDKTLYKGIKDNDVSKILDVTEEGGRLSGNQLAQEQQELELIVNQMRRKYDELRIKTSKLETDNGRNRRTLEAYQQEEGMLKTSIQQAKDQLQNKQKNGNALFEQMQARIYDFDIYKEMEDRLKHDILILKKRNFDKDYSLKKDHMKARTLRHDEFNKTRMTSQCKTMLQSIQKTVVQKQMQRTTKINSFYEVLHRKHDNIRKRNERQLQVEEVIIRTMGEKSQEEKEWINICRVNLFLKAFLKDKMERLIAENLEVETAYHKIKSGTDLVDSKQLITRFLNRQKDYGSLLEAISEKQSILENVRLQRQKLQHSCHQLQQQSELINENSMRQIKDCEPLQKQLEGLEEQLKHIQGKRELMNKWAVRFTCAYFAKTRDQIQQKYQKLTFLDMLKTVLQEMKTYTDNVLQNENNANSINDAFLSTKPTPKIFNEDMLVRNNRVRLSTMEDSAYEGEDRQIQFYDGASEADYMQHNRRMIKRNDLNRKFRVKTQMK